MLLHDRLDGGKTQAAAARLSRKTSLKNPVANVFRDPRTGVFDLDSDVPPGGKPGRLRNIHHILGDLRKLNRITNDRIQIPLKGKLGFELRPAKSKKDGMSENFRNIERLFNRRTAFGESEQASGQVGGTLGALARVLEVLRQPFIEGRQGSRQIQIGNDHLKDVVEIVSDTTSERSDEFESLDAELGLHLPLFGDVSVNHQDRARISLAVSQEGPPAVDNHL